MIAKLRETNIPEYALIGLYLLAFWVGAGFVFWMVTQ